MVFGYVNLSSINKDLSENNFSIKIEQKLYKANLQTKALHDPNNVMLKNNNRKNCVTSCVCT